MRVSDVQVKIRDFDFGTLNKKNKPSLLKIEKKNLRHNATQIGRLMLHTPFILAPFKTQLEPIWPAVNSQLIIMQIVYSKNISELEQLTEQIQLHLESLIQIFKTTLLPKHHNLTHNSNAIRAMGPIIYNWMMRFENKHQFFTHIAHDTNNFVNIAKTMAKKHQEAICYRNFTTSNMEFSKMISAFNKIDVSDNFKKLLHNYFGIDNYYNLISAKFVKKLSNEYREGLLIILNMEIFEIVHILRKTNEQEVFVSCQSFLFLIF